MADSKITALTSIGTSTDPSLDQMVIVDTSDGSMAATGTTKKVSLNQLLSSNPSATGGLTLSGALAAGSATITGDLTVASSILKVSGGNVGINTASPTNTAGYKTLEIVGTGVNTGGMIRMKSSDASVSSLDFVDNNGRGIFAVSNHNLRFGCNDIEQYRIQPLGIFTWYDGAGGTRMTLNSTGLGVGVTPSYKLHVTDNTTGLQARLSSTSTSGTSLEFQNTGTGGRSWRIGSGFAVTAGNFEIYDSTAAANRLSIDSSGNVGVGVTPSAWNSNYNAFDIGQNGTIAGRVGSSNTVDIISNGFRNTSGNWVYKLATSNTACRYQIDGSTGSHIWYTGAAGTAGNTISGFSSALMTLDASGNLLVGNTGNPNTARAYFRYDTLTTQPVINSASVVAASTSWSHFIGQSGNGSSITTSNIFIYGNGNIQNINGVYGTISDLRLKENISDARNYLADLLKLRVVKYSLKEEASAVANKLGFIAQEVEQVFPAMVDTDPNDGNKGIKTSVLIPMLVKAIQELTARVEALEA